MERNGINLTLTLTCFSNVVSYVFVSFCLLSFRLSSISRIWGLFKEPLYPFLLLQFEIKEMALPGEEKDSIKPFKLYAQINHKRGDNGEVILASVTDLAVREKETIKADPFGAAKLDLFENVVIGKLQLQAQL